MHRHHVAGLPAQHVEHGGIGQAETIACQKWLRTESCIERVQPKCGCIAVGHAAGQFNVAGRAVRDPHSAVPQNLQVAVVHPHRVRGDALDKAADLFEESTAELVAMCVREAGKSIPDALAEV